MTPDAPDPVALRRRVLLAVAVDRLRRRLACQAFLESRGERG